MKVTVRRAICAVAGSLVFAGAACGAVPVAQPFVPLAADSPTVVALDFAQPLNPSAVSYGPPGAAAFESASTSVALLDGVDLQVGYKVDLSAGVPPAGATATHGLDGLFLSSAAVGAPYSSLAAGGEFAGITASLTRDLHVSAGFASLSPGQPAYTPDAMGALARLAGTPMPYAARSADSALAGLSWDATNWASFGVTASRTAERDGILNVPVPGAAADTTALGLSARLRFGNGWVTTASYSEGITQLDLKAGVAPALTGDALRTRSYGIAIAKNGLFGNDALGFAVSRPAIGSDSEFVSMPGMTGASFFARNHMLEGASASSETDVEIGYITTFLDGSLALQTNASFQMNYAGQNGANAVSLLSRARIKF
ncbi:MAG: hypothetical protein WDM91_12655 [Rhizomicrobium sp.]